MLVRAGTREMRERQVGRKEWKNSARGRLPSVEGWEKDGCCCGSVGNLQARRRSDSEIHRTPALFARPPTPLHPGPRLAGFPSDGSARAGIIPARFFYSRDRLGWPPQSQDKKQAGKGRHIQLTIYFPLPLPNTRLSHSASFSVLMYRSS
jgi:hypothetical protein